MKKLKYIKFSEPLIEQKEISEVSKTLKSGWLTTGNKTKIFERNFLKYKNAKYAVALNSCTAAIHLSLMCLSLKPEDEVITSALTFCSTVNSIIHAGARPILADVELDTQNIDPKDIEKKITKKTKAILVVHFGGRPCKMTEIMKIAKKNKLIVIEDCAHAIETKYKGKHVGNFGDFGCFSFYATKNLVTGEGGMLITKNKKYFNKTKILSLHGMDKTAWKRYGKLGYRHYDVSEVGFKYNMMDLQAAIGIHQLNRIEKNHKKRKKIFNNYKKNLKSLNIILPNAIDKNIKHSYHLFTLLINKKINGINRDEFMLKMHKHQIGVGIHYRSIPEHSIYRKKFGWKLKNYPNSKKIGQETVSIPLSPALSKIEVNKIIKSIKQIIKN